MLSINNQPLSLYDTPSDALIDRENLPTLEETNHLALSYQNGSYPRQGQVYVRLAWEENGVLNTSPIALFYNFSENQTAADFFLGDILNLNDNNNYDLVQIELIHYWKESLSDYQFALARLPA